AAITIRFWGPEMDRQRNEGISRWPYRKSPADTYSSAGRLPARVQSWLGRQNLLHATSCGAAAANQRGGALAAPVGTRCGSCSAQETSDSAYGGKPVLR